MPGTAVVLFNLGGPDGPRAVRPFLANLFGDPVIIGLPWPLRPLLAHWIAARRAPLARKIYAQIGGGSPLLANTESQARALADLLGDGWSVHVAMRYWHPRADDVARTVMAARPDRVVLLPLYPQYSTTTTGSSVADWLAAARRAGLDAPTRPVCCWPAATGWIAALAARIAPALARARAHGEPRLLLTAHGLPKRVIERGDPYQWQVERTAGAVLEALASNGAPAADAVVCYQSRVGPLEWIGPSTDDEIRRAGAGARPLVVAPVAFVSEHSETLVELDIEYRELGRAAGVPFWERVPTVDDDAAFIGALAALARAAAAGATGTDNGPVCDGGGRLCPAALTRCPRAA